MDLLDATEQMGGSAVVRQIFTAVLTVILIVTIVLNALAGVGTGPFSMPTGNVSHLYNTCITPAGYTFSIWSVIYILLVFIVIYSLTLLCRKDLRSGECVWRLGGAVPASYLIMFSLNLLINIGWLFAWDSLLLTGSAIGLLLIALTNCIALGLSAYWFSVAAHTLQQKSRADFWCGVVVINGHATYTTWTCLAAFLNLAIFLIHEVILDATTVCVTLLSLIPAAMIVFALLEALVFVRSLNVLLSHYFVYLWASIGIYSKNSASASSGEFGLLVANIAVAAALCVLRVLFVAFRNRHNAVFGGGVEPNSFSKRVQ